METTSIRLPIRKLPEHFDRSRITVGLEEIEMALMDDGGVKRGAILVHRSGCVLQL